LNHFVLTLGASAPYLGLPVVTTLEAARANLGALPGSSFQAGIVNYGATAAPPLAQKQFVNRWFASTFDLHYDERRPTTPMNPLTAAGGVVPLEAYARITAGVNSATVARDYPYTWAAMVQRSLPLADPNPGTASPQTYRPAPTDRTKPYQFDGTVRLLGFHKRNLSRPYLAIHGCFFEGSRRVTLTWDNAALIPPGKLPTIKRGVWLCEATITGGRETGLYGGGVLSRHRRSMNFYRVVEVGDPKVVGSRIYQTVDIDRPASDCDGRYFNPANTLETGDQRPTPDGLLSGATIDYFVPPVWPIVDPVVAQRITFYSVIIFDGLEYVF
jgi:hypothetical protein